MKLMRHLSAAVLVLCLVSCLCACGNESAKPQEDTTVTTTTTTTQTTQDNATQENGEAAAFQVNVVDQNGTPVAGVMMQVCKDVCVPKVTDADGVAAFDLEITDGYTLKVLSCPAGYTYSGDEEVYLEAGISEYTIEVQGEA